MKQTKHSEKILKEALSPKNKRAAGEKELITRGEHALLIEKSKNVELFNEKLRNDMIRLQEQVRRLEIERATTPRGGGSLILSSFESSQKSTGDTTPARDNTTQKNMGTSSKEMAELAMLAYQVVETGGENRDALVSKVEGILGPNKFAKLDKSLDGLRSPLQRSGESSSGGNSSGAELSPISHSNHLAFLKSTQEELKKSASKKKFKKKRTKKVRNEQRRDSINKEDDIDSPSWVTKSMSNKTDVGAGTPQPKRVPSINSGSVPKKRPSSAGPKRRKGNRAASGAGAGHGTTRGMPATRAQIQKLKQRLMRTIVANRLFSANELNFVFENAIELSPFNRDDMHQMIFELKEELGLTNTLDQNDWIDDEDMNRTYNSNSHQNQGRQSRSNILPGSHHYHHDLAGTRKDY
jgi:hypothetical protein